jgi:hypothetical protein
MLPVQITHAGGVKLLLFYITEILKKLFPPFSEKPWLVTAAPSQIVNATEK